MLVLLWASVSSASMCINGGDDTDEVFPVAERVYRGRVVELWASTEEARYGDCAERFPPGSYSLPATDECMWGRSVAVFEVLDVWKGPADRRLELLLDGSRHLQVGWTGVVFQRGDYDIADCGWSGGPALGPPQVSFEEAWTAEDFLWKAVADNDPERVGNALAYAPRIDGQHYLEQELSRACPPPAYDELIRAGVRSVDGIAHCSAERILPLLGVVPPGDPAWEEVALRADLPLLQRLEAAGIPMKSISTWGFFAAWGEVPKMYWWLA